MNYKIFVESERSLSIRFSAPSSAILCQQIQKIATQIQARLGAQLIDLTPAFNTLLVTFDPFSIKHAQVAELIDQILFDNTSAPPNADLTEHILPVYYDFSDQWDLLTAADQLGLSPEQLINAHQNLSYQVYAIGFAPGFAYLGDLPPALCLPRHATPRTQVPAGAVAIAENMTAVYPQSSPGGWHILGHCPSVLFDLSRTPACPLQVGDTVRFETIDRDTFMELRGQP